MSMHVWPHLFDGCASHIGETPKSTDCIPSITNTFMHEFRRMESATHARCCIAERLVTLNLSQFPLIPPILTILNLGSKHVHITSKQVNLRWQLVSRVHLLAPFS